MNEKNTNTLNTDKRMLAVEVQPVAEHEAEQLALFGAVLPNIMNTTPENKADAMQSEQESAAMCASTDAETLTDADADVELSSDAPACTPELTPEATEPVFVMPESLGQRLRAARELRCWTCEEVATRMRLPLQVVHTLEADRYERVGHGIYLRGYLSSYVRLLGLPSNLIDEVVREHDQEQPLVASGKISHTRYLFQRYSVSALYLVLTGVIIVPAVLLAMRANFEPNLAQFTSLDAPITSLPRNDAVNPSTDVATSDPAQTSGSVTTTTAAIPKDSGSEAPLVASMTPFSLTPSMADPTPASTNAGAHAFTLTLKEASWVEIVGANGEKLEYAILPAGTQKTYTSTQALDIRLGNSNGAQLEVAGQAQDLAPYRHANVAHFKVFAGGQAISHTDS